MALWKSDYSGWTVDLGDPQFKADVGEQLKVTADELCGAINACGVGHVLFRRVLDLRSKAHSNLLERLPESK